MTPRRTAGDGINPGWIVVGGAFVVLFFGFGSAYSFGTFFEHFERDFGASRASVSLVFSIAAFLFFSLGAIFGPVADRFGPRWLAVAGMAIAGLGLMLVSRATALWQADLAYGLGVGLGVGMAYVPAVGAVQKWFVRRRGLASGLAVAGIGAGTLCMPIVASTLIGWAGWRDAFLFMGLAVAVCGGAAGLLVRGSARPAHAASARAPQTGAPDTPLRAAVLSRPFLLIYAGYVLISLANFVPLVHLVPYALDRDIATEISVILLGLIGVGSTVGRFAVGGAADRFGLQRSLAVAFGGLGLSCLWWAVSTEIWQLAVFALWMGVCYGGFVALGPAVMADYFGVRNVSGITGALYSGVGISTLVGAPLAGLAYDLTGSYLLPIVASGVTGLAAAGCVALAPTPARWRAAYGAG